MCPVNGQNVCSSQEVEESCRDCDFSVLILLELEDAPDELDQSDDASDQDEWQNQLYDTGKDPSVEVLVDSKTSKEEDKNEIQDLVDFLHVDLPTMVE